jgi:hypothetical protein
MKSLDRKLASIQADPTGSAAFILADARDADMAFGLAATGTDPATGRARSLAEYREQMREVVHQGLVDIMLMSPSTNELLAADEHLFDGSTVTPAVRANESSDIHACSGATYAGQRSEPFRTARVDELRLGGTDLALYSLTPTLESAQDVRILGAYREFRAEAEQAGLRHFLEVFAPNVPEALASIPDPGRFMNDFVVRTLAGVPRSGRPIFLKLPYFGAQAMEALVAYDPLLVPGVLGGSAGTTYDAFFLLEDARRHGARAALFGRKIKQAEHQLEFVRHLRLIADGETSAADACRSYHAELQRLGIRPHRPLDEDLQLSAASAAYAPSLKRPVRA